MSNKNFLQNIVLTRGAKEGYCNICKQYGKLTRDHVPPKGSIKITPVELRTLGQDRNTPPYISQNGTNFRTICGRCNNTLLGTEYDPELNKVSNKIGSLVKKSCNLSCHDFSLPSEITLEVKPQKLARAVIGHLLASDYDPERNIQEKALFTDVLREYFLDSKAKLPKELDIYYWYYPSNQQVLIHGAGRLDTRVPDKLVSFSLMKFFPIAYMITYQEHEEQSINALSLFADRNIGVEDTEKIRINIASFPNLDDPESPKQNDIIFINSQSTSITRKRKKKGFGRK